MNCAAVGGLCERTWALCLAALSRVLGRRAFWDLVARAPSVNRPDSRVRCEDYCTMKFPPGVPPTEYKLETPGCARFPPVTLNVLVTMVCDTAVLPPV